MIIFFFLTRTVKSLRMQRHMQPITWTVPGQIVVTMQQVRLPQEMHTSQDRRRSIERVYLCHLRTVNRND